MVLRYPIPLYSDIFDLVNPTSTISCLNEYLYHSTFQNGKLSLVYQAKSQAMKRPSNNKFRICNIPNPLFNTDPVPN